MRTLSQKNRKPDYIFALTVFLLVFFGIVMISSSSVVLSMESVGHNYYYVSRQMLSLLFGLIFMFITANMDYRIYKKYSFWMLVVTLGLLILVFVPGIGKSAGGAHRWIGIGSRWFQPSEIIKLTFVVYLAAWLDNKKESVKGLFTGFIPFSILIFIIGFLIMEQPDLGTMSVIVLSAVIVFFVSGAELTHLLAGFVAALISVGVLIKSAPYRMQRLLVFLNPNIDTQGAAYHINQALLAIGAGGWWGLGFGQSRQKYLYLPQPHTDSIFAIIAEELGFVRSSILIIAFIFLAIRGFKIAKTAPDTFSRLLVIGITSWILVQALINIGAMINLVPLTGVPMPFISYGGSSLMVLLAAVGIVLNISKHTGENI